MKNKSRLTKLAVLFLFCTVLLTSGIALAQAYFFSLPTFTVHAFWNEDGALSIDYVYEFQNHPSGHPIEFVDVGLPNRYFDEGNIFADVNGNPITDISRSDYEGEGQGVAVALGQYAIPPGESGVVHVFIGSVERKLERDPSGDEYASAVFGPAYFDSSVVFGATDLTVTFHLPPGVQPEEPRWHAAPSGFPEEPQTGIDDEGRITYTWRNPNASPDTLYNFGASFPDRYVPADAIVSPSPFEGLAGLIDFECLLPLACFGFFGLIILLAVAGERQRKLKYLPPKIAIEGHGIKRGLTAVEAAILLEEPMDKIMTMILFGAIKKEAAAVLSRDPLELEVADPLPSGLRPYETEFLEAFKNEKNLARQRDLQKTMVGLIKSVSQKMKGFSHKETVAYYRDIMQRAWAEVEAADTPEVQGQKFDEVMEWTMLDRDFDRRSREVFRGPVIIPTWWGRYDPGYGRAAPSVPRTAAPTAGRPSGGLPTLPGGEFAASMVGGIQTFSSKVVGNITDFTGRVTQQTNPPPKPTSGGGYRGGGGGGGGCACACACAGCACACAGGGR